MISSVPRLWSGAFLCILRVKTVYQGPRYLGDFNLGSCLFSYLVLSKIKTDFLTRAKRDKVLQSRFLTLHTMPSEKKKEGYHSMSEVTSLLEVTEHQLRNWEKLFPEFLSLQRNEFNHRVFTDKDIEILSEIRKLYESGFYTTEGVREQLRVYLQQGTKEEYDELKNKLMTSLNNLTSEMSALRKEIREDLKYSIKGEIEHLMHLLGVIEEKRKWWDFWKR